MITLNWRRAGDPCLGAAMIDHVYAELPEFSAGGSLEEVRQRMLEATVQLDRCELLAMVDGQVVGFACIAEDDDMHAGRCLSLQWQYVVPAYRGKVGALFLRQLVRMGRRLGFKLVSYSHRRSQHHYAIKYRRLDHGQEN
jgi:GNAT superfamily N-acetyltransferase